MTTLSTFLGFFNILAGLMLVAAVLSFVGGFIRYLVVLGNVKRKDGLVFMVWGIAILFVLVVLLGIVNILQGPFFFLLSIALVLFVCFVLVIALSRVKGKSTPEH